MKIAIIHPQPITTDYYEYETSEMIKNLNNIIVLPYETDAQKQIVWEKTLDLLNENAYLFFQKEVLPKPKEPQISAKQLVQDPEKAQQKAEKYMKDFEEWKKQDDERISFGRKYFGYKDLSFEEWKKLWSYNFNEDGTIVHKDNYRVFNLVKIVEFNID